jgi:hypothetical protein
MQIKHTNAKNRTRIQKIKAIVYLNPKLNPKSNLELLSAAVVTLNRTLSTRFVLGFAFLFLLVRAITVLDEKISVLLLRRKDFWTEGFLSLFCASSWASESEFLKSIGVEKKADDWRGRYSSLRVNSIGGSQVQWKKEWMNWNKIDWSREILDSVEERFSAKENENLGSRSLKPKEGMNLDFFSFIIIKLKGQFFLYLSTKPLVN